MLYNNSERCEIFARYIIETGATVRATAANFLISKSTVHKDVTTKLKTMNPALYAEVSKVLAKNKEERHLRGGEATKRKYQNEKEQRFRNKSYSHN